MYRTANFCNLVWTRNAYFDTLTADTDANSQVAAGNSLVNRMGDDVRLAAATSPGVTLGPPVHVDLMPGLVPSHAEW